ncbi:MAG TPA: LytTR family DNA-binding domain-containing protein [Gemmatimonadales bacterium]|nr:LytTR family DNA-binding domain-containing protein [Gemmatimonadales bacterium]
MAELRVLLVDDEPLVREGLRDFLGEEPGLCVAGECSNGAEALQFLAAHEVDVVFLDVQMPELDGLGVASVLVREGGPAIVFVTAFSEHAIRAFELNAIDYLLKPFDRERFHAAVNRIRTRLGSGSQEELARRLAAVLGELQRGRGYADRVVVKSEGRIRFVAVEELDWVEAADNYVRLHAGNQRHLVRETIRSVEARLDPARFARIHRSAIVNLSKIRELQPTFNGEYAVLLTSGARLTLSRTYRDAVRARLGGEI